MRRKATIQQSSSRLANAATGDVDVGGSHWDSTTHACKSFVPCQEAAYLSTGNLQLDKEGNGGKCTFRQSPAFRPFFPGTSLAIDGGLSRIASCMPRLRCGWSEALVTKQRTSQELHSQWKSTQIGAATTRSNEHLSVKTVRPSQSWRSFSLVPNPHRVDSDSLSLVHKIRRGGKPR